MENDINYGLLEVIADIASLVTEAQFFTPDSRERRSLTIEWAEEFAGKNKERFWDGEYLDELEMFVKSKLEAAVRDGVGTIENFREWSYFESFKKGVIDLAINDKLPVDLTQLEFHQVSPEKCSV